MRRLAAGMHGKLIKNGKRVVDGAEVLEDVCCAENPRRVQLREKVCAEEHEDVFRGALGSFYDSFCGSEGEMSHALVKRLSKLPEKRTP